MVTYLETVPTPRWIILLSWGAAVAFLIGAGVVFVQSPSLLSGILLAFLFLAIGAFWTELSLVFDHLKIEVRDGGISFRFGPFGTWVRGSDIARAEVQRYPWLVYGGWGIRFATRGRRAYSVPGYPRGVSLFLQNENPITFPAKTLRPYDQRFIACWPRRPMGRGPPVLIIVRDSWRRSPYHGGATTGGLANL